MERLTERTADGILVKENHGENGLRTFYQCFGGKPNANYSNCEEGYCAMEKLAAYEDAEEQGLLLRLPCKVGDVAYVIIHNAVKKEIVRDVQYRGQTYAEGQRWFLNIGALLYCENDIGKMVFLTREEAEAKLKEMEV